MHLAGRASAATAAALSVLAAAACAPVTTMAPQQPPAPAAESGPPPSVTVVTVPRPARKPVPPLPTEPAALPGPPGVPSASSAGFERLNGLDQSATLALLGPPRQRAESPPATIWRYVTTSCELDVYFYLDLRTNEMRALHYEIRSQDHDAAERSQQRCYEQLTSERSSSPEPTVSADRAR